MESLATTINDLNIQKDQIFLEKEQMRKELEHVEKIRESLCGEIEKLLSEKDNWGVMRIEVAKQNEEMYPLSLLYLFFYFPIFEKIVVILFYFIPFDATKSTSKSRTGKRVPIVPHQNRKFGKTREKTGIGEGRGLARGRFAAGACSYAQQRAGSICG